MPDTPGGEPRVEAAAKAMWEARSPLAWATLGEASQHSCRGQARLFLAAADKVDPLRSPATTDDRAAIERIAFAFHWEYERTAQREGWATQKTTQVSWDELPEANRRTMVATVKALLNLGIIQSGRIVDPVRLALPDIEEALIDHLGQCPMVEMAQRLNGTPAASWWFKLMELRAALDSLPLSLKVATEEGDNGE